MAGPMNRFASVGAEANFSKLPLTVSFLPLSVAITFPSAPLTLSAVTLIPAPVERKDGTADSRALYLSPPCARAVTATHANPNASHTAKYRLKAMLTPPSRILAARIQRMYTAATQIMNGRKHLAVLIVAAALIATAAVAYAIQSARSVPDSCAGARDLRLTNGRIVTLDKQNMTVSEVTIQNGRFDTVGPIGNRPVGPCTKIIDLGGRTAVPGIVDNHNHIVLLGLRPGHDTRLETAASIADVQAIIKARAAKVPAGEFITAMGGWNPAQFS